MKRIYREKKIMSGNFISAFVYPVFKEVKGRRKKRAKPTGEAQRMLNRLYASMKLNHLLCANFTENDLKYELTYTNQQLPNNETDVLRDMQNYFKRVNRKMMKHGLSTLKYVYAIERGTQLGRFHIHVVMSGGLAPDEINQLWGKGYVRNMAALQFSADGLAGLASYMTGYKKDGYHEPLMFRKWNSSKNLVKPNEPPTNDYRYTARMAKEIAEGEISPYTLERLYPGYELAECEHIKNEYNNGYYLRLRLYRRGTRLLR